MPSLLGLDDMSHAQASMTTNNAQTSFLGKLPLEIRIAIYEEVFLENAPIRPTPVANKSNKFVCTFEGYGVLSDRDKQTSKRVFVMSQLSHTCRHFYFDLENYPVFYRVNIFKFRTIQMLLNFLSAITPERRSFLRRIIYHTTGFEELAWKRSWAGGRIGSKGARLFPHVAALLHKCEDLRDFQVFLGGESGWYGSAKDTIDKLTKVIKSSARHTGNWDNMQIWLLPTIRPMIVADDHVMQKDAIDLTNVDLYKFSASDAHLRAPAREAGKALFALRRRLEKAKADGHEVKITQTQIQYALQASGIDFPGEDRVEQNRFDSITGTVSSRTRQKCNKNSVNDLGVIQDTTNKHTPEGILIRNFFIRDVRWNDSTIECRVEEIGMDQSWEDIEATLTFGGLYYMIRYYEDFINDKSWSDPVDRSSKIQSMPTPHDIVKAIQHFVEDMFVDSRGDYRTWNRDWRRTQECWDRMLEEVEREIEIKEKLATKRVTKKRKSRKTPRATTEASKRRK